MRSRTTTASFIVLAAMLAACGSDDSQPRTTASIKHTSGIPAYGHMRVARPTDHLDEILRFYRDGLGLDVIDQFQDHEGFDGVMLGRKGLGWHLEFTRKRGHEAGRAPTHDNLIVFYLPEPSEWQTAVDRMKAHGYQPVPSFNPYWDRNGKTFEDVDGYRVVLQQASWD